MEVKRVIKLFFLLMVVAFSGNAQEKYLLYNPEKDSIICRGDTKYYKIDNNLFDVNRYDKIDVINCKQLKPVKFYTVKELYQRGNRISDSILKEELKKERITVFETRNQIFEYIYVLEKLPNCKYKRTRVWWIDY